MNSEGIVLEHRKSGARLFLMSNDDDNKVFSIGFRTPPADSTGLPHILEHSVLEGSEKFPVKDPFVELVKGSLRNLEIYMGRVFRTYACGNPGERR